MFRRVLAALALLTFAVVLGIIAWPQLAGLQRTPIIAQATSLRAVLAGVALLCVVVAGLLALMWPGIRRAAGAVALLLLGFSLLQFAVLATRGGGDTAFQAKAPGDVTVLAWNTLGEMPTIETAAELAIGADADILVLPETTRPYADSLKNAIALGGTEMAVHHVHYDDISKARTTSVLVNVELGEYAIDSSVGNTDTLPSVVLVPVDGDGPRIIGAHPVAPVPGEMAGWRQGLQWLAARCSGANTILAGDLNSTLDHYVGLDPASERTGGLGDCLDGGRATGNGAVGTWPTNFPALLGAPIDHVMATDEWEFVGFRVVESLDDAGSDHRPVIAQLRPVG